MHTRTHTHTHTHTQQSTQLQASLTSPCSMLTNAPQCKSNFTISTLWLSTATHNGVLPLCSTSNKSASSVEVCWMTSSLSWVNNGMYVHASLPLSVPPSVPLLLPPSLPPSLSPSSLSLSLSLSLPVSLPFSLFLSPLSFIHACVMRVCVCVCVCVRERRKIELTVGGKKVPIPLNGIRTRTLGYTPTVLPITPRG